MGLILAGSMVLLIPRIGERLAREGGWVGGEGIVEIDLTALGIDQLAEVAVAHGFGGEAVLVSGVRWLREPSQATKKKVRLRPL